MRILIIDDNADYLSLIAEAVASEGYEVVTAENGRDGLKFAGLQVFDLVVTDIFMPEMDGIALILELRQKQPGIPVIAMSGGGRYGDLQALKTSSALGATHTLLKPFRLNVLTDLIREVIGSA